MNKATGTILMAQLARLKHQQAEHSAREAELLAEEARLYDQLAGGETVDLRTGRVRPKSLRPLQTPADVKPEEIQNVRDALRNNEMRRRLAK